MPYLGLRGKKLLTAISVTAGVGFCLFGIDNAALGGVISSDPFNRRFNLDPTGQGAVTGAYEIGCFFGALFFAFFGEKVARRTVLLIGCVPLLIGTVLQVATYSTAQLVVGRVVAGLAMGAITSTLPIWQNETSPPALRGTLICASLSMLIVGQLIAYWAAYGLLDKYDNDMVYRVMFSLQGMAAVLMAALLSSMPESPRFLLAHSRPDEARRVLSALADIPENDPVVTEQMEEIVRAIELESTSARNWSDLIKRGKDAQGEKRRMFTAVVIQVCQAFSGSTVISYYVTTIFQEAIGMSPHTSTLLSGYLQIFFLVCSFATWWLIEHAGRRRLFILTAFAMAVVMFIMGGLIKIDTKPTGIGAAVMVFAYQAFFTWGWMAGVWVYSSEICPLSWRSKGMGLAVALQWLFDFVLLMVTPIGIANIGYGMFMLFGAFNLCFIPFVYFYCPETAGVPLESIDTFYLPGVDPINESERLRQEIRDARKGEKEVLAMEEAIIGEEPILDEEEKEHVGETGK
ncbi:monosaccharide transporter [Cryptococcus deuterogattii MMRL2647]|nr:monosaccharide transporter [Cryptococcus deuterogattii MMRL2647]